MVSYCLFFDNEIIKLEQANLLEIAAEKVYQKWKNHPDNLHYLLCAGTELWYTLLDFEYEQCSRSSLNNSETLTKGCVQQRLAEVTQYGCKTFEANPVFNLYFGYMISVMPIHFMNYRNDYMKLREQGTIMISKAYQLDPENPFVQAIYCNSGYSENHLKYYNLCEKIWKNVSPEQWGYSQVNQYFFRILNGNRYYPEAYTSY